MGRFINADAITGETGTLLSHNMFAYCSNNPIVRRDPDGFRWLNDILPGSEERADKAFNSWYDFGNWLTIGAFDTIKGTVSPEKPFSLQHWIDSANAALLTIPVAGGVSKLVGDSLAKRASVSVVKIVDAPKPPGWNSNWKWRYPEGESFSKPRWFDEYGGEWRRHNVDKWHPQAHWDHNPWDSWNSPWRNIDDNGNLMKKN